MSNIFNVCCIKEPNTSEKTKLNELKALMPLCDPLNGDSNGFDTDNPKTKPNLRIKVPQPLRLRNLQQGTEDYDVFHSHNEEVAGQSVKCTPRVCQGSLTDIPSRGGTTPRTPDEVYYEAQIFLKQYFASIKRENSETHTARLDEIRKELKEKGTFQLRNSELVFGAKLAWRNASRCIGRIQWKKLQIFDCTEVRTASAMFRALCNHIKYSTNKGNIRSAITIFPPRTDGQHDYRIWNSQLISYAGYVQPDGTILGDPAHVEFTEVCIKLGWKPVRTAFEVLPLLLSADGKEPELFEIPPEIVMQVELEHPNYEWFKDLGLRWYALPAVANMKLDCGGLEFTATAFNGWYMNTEIGCRNLCDPHRYNVIERVAKKMGLNTNTYATLWKDRALVEVNVAVLHSFHKLNVSIVDHHTASEQFMTHYQSEIKSRGGCPSDWVWIVPPMSGSQTEVFHQEMVLYYIRPSYDQQVPAWKTHQWKKSDNNKPKRKFHFKQIARAVKFTSKLFSQALSKRIKATILYATETGKSEQYAKELGNIFGHVFNVHVLCMSEYDIFSIEHETLLIIVTSTFGNGEPPANGFDFAEHLYKMLYNENKHIGDQTGNASSGVKVPTPRSLMRTNSLLTPSIEYKKQFSRLDSIKSINAPSSVGQIGPLSNVNFAVFALGSSAYPKFCNFGKNVDKILGELGGERILEVTCGDELYGQEQQFRNWSSKIFHVACEIFCLEDYETVGDAKKALGKVPLTEETVKFSKTSVLTPLKSALESCYKKQLISCKVTDNKYLGDTTEDRATIFVEMETDDQIKYEPGDHVGIMPCNNQQIVDAVLKRLKCVDDLDKPVQLQVMKETLTLSGVTKTWQRHETLPAVSTRMLFTRFLDITTPPSTTILNYLADSCSDITESNKIRELVNDSNKYNDWRHYYFPHLAEVFEQFPSCRPRASLLVALLPRLQPRFYSVSSSPLAHPKKIQVTVALVMYESQDKKGPTHYGVCTSYLQSSKMNDEVFVFIRRAPNFHMPQDITAPLILVGPGSGIAPFRGFWHHRRHLIKTENRKPGPMWLLFGCRYSGMDLYKEEKEEAQQDGVLTQTMLALSREDNSCYKYVQDILEKEGEKIASMILNDNGHFYVCGDCKMAEEVQHTLKEVLKIYGKMDEEQVENFLLDLMDDNRYHEDIFGITLRTTEVQTASRETAKQRVESVNS